MSPNTPPRVKGLDYMGPRQYFVTTCTYRHLNWLADEEQARKIAVQVSPFFEARGFAVLAYCLMPDHAHLLLENPVRAGLVSLVTDYQWIGSCRFGIQDLLTHAGEWKPAWKSR